MRTSVLALAAVLSLLVVSVALADDYNANGTVTQGTGVQVATATGGSSWAGSPKLGIQCPNMDGGTGQQVYYRPGCATCIVDAGPGDYFIDFTKNTDGFPLTLRAGMDRVNLRAFNPTDALWCTVVPRSP